MDHISEFSDYYSALDEMEKKLKEQKGEAKSSASRKFTIRDQEMGVGDDVHWMSGGTWDGVITNIKKNPSGTHNVTVDAIDGKSYTLKPAEDYGINLGRSKFYSKGD